MSCIPDVIRLLILAVTTSFVCVVSSESYSSLKEEVSQNKYHSVLRKTLERAKVLEEAFPNTTYRIVKNKEGEYRGVITAKFCGTKTIFEVEGDSLETRQK